VRSYYGLRTIGGSDPWRQMVLLTLAAAVFLSASPQAAYADTPTYDPVFRAWPEDSGVGPRASGSSSGKDDEAGDVDASAMQTDAVRVENKPFEARSSLRIRPFTTIRPTWARPN
jgi:hypothetical protein